MSSLFRNYPRFATLAGLVAISLTSSLHAEDRKYVVGTTINVAGGGANGLNSAGAAAPNRNGSAYYEVDPAIYLQSTAQHSSLALSYAYGLNRTVGDVRYDSNSHVVGMNYSALIGPKWRLSLSESFLSASNLTAFNITRGVATPDGFRFVFSPVAYNQTTQTNGLAVGATYAATDKSTLSFSVSHYLLRYPGNTAFLQSLSNQQRVSESVTYSQKATERGAWNVSYSGSYLTFAEFDTTRSHAVSAGYSYQFNPTVNLYVGGGPSYVENVSSGGTYKTYNVAASIQKAAKANTFSFHYRHDAGEASGLGSVGDTDTGGFSTSHQMSRNTNLFVDISAFNTRGRLNNPYSARGVAAGANVSVNLNRNVSFQWGVLYQRQDNTTLFAYEQKRIYVSLRVNAPELWKFSR